ncbi:MAG TPA: hypothetical protein VNQ80_00195 [Parapedobacter sp.]|uniref:hypothetical protein n=1 Tax=Parapedobacter sp. TaxID=1958893 RepID=UPI002BEFF156|nr:hypothetical protein [Parapedobacter sp.]HWK55719.1 hypothetical protein [Parapedobacter sp.]
MMEKLVGTSVMVHPELTTDPVNMQGHLGTISHVIYEDNSVYVKFKNHVIGLYDTNALLMLVPVDMAIDKLRSDIDMLNMNASDVVDIMEMYQLDATGIPEVQQEALDWAVTHDKISGAVVFSVEDWIEFQIGRPNQQQQPGRGI